MPLRIFVSSVSTEFLVERKALEREINQLGELYAGMEYFGSDPRSAANFDDTVMGESDLYVGLLGDLFGSTESSSGKSFTQLEYESARIRRIPTLVYFKSAYITGSEELQQVAFKRRVQLDQLGAVFRSIHELEIQFLIDLFKQIRGPLFAKLRPQLGLIPFDTLHAVTKGLLPEQIKAVGRDKYIPQLYVSRPAEARVHDFVNFEERFITRSQEILATIELIAGTYGFETSAQPALLDARSAILRSHDKHALGHAAAALKRACFFDSIEADFADLERIDRELNPALQYRLLQELAGSFRSRSYIARSELPELLKTISLTARGRVAAGGAVSVTNDLKVRSFFPSIGNEKKRILANDLLKEFALLIEKSSKCCIALVDRAGRGKTNLVCRIAENTIEKDAVVLFSGRMEISTEYDIEWHIQRQIETAFGAAFADWIARSAPALEQERRWLFVVLDGINESTNLPLFIRLLQNFLPKLEGKRIRVILSCRDIYWDLFLSSINPYLFEDAVHPGEFSELDWKRATDLYFERFQITANIEDKAAFSLRNPLLLRFFCEAHQGQNLGLVSNVHLRTSFKLYVDRVGRSIVERKGLLNADLVLDLLLRIVSSMWQNRLPAIEQSRLSLTPEEMSSSESIYNLIRSENVILDEARHIHTTLKTVRFVYDEFMEYMLARSWLEEIANSPAEDSAIEALLQQAMDAIIAFPASLGAILFLDELLSRNGQLVNRAIGLSGPVRDILLHSRQATLLYALENIDASNVDDDLLKVVDQFEITAAVELRPRLALVIVRLLEKNPRRSALRPIVERMLEVLPDSEASAAGGGKLDPNLAAKLEALQQNAKKTTLPPLKSEEEKEEEEAKIPLLPPARYHYTEETKLNAIALIIGARNPDAYELAEEGIRRLGRMDLHAALYALRSVDIADDGFVYKTIEGHINAALPEYRIYCAWLLRERYGPKPAEFLLRLLSAEETRVHRYTFSLFETRQIEKELLHGILVEMRVFESMKPWLLIYRIKLLSRRVNFAPSDISDTLGQAVAEMLKAVVRHARPSIRLEAYRALNEYPEFIDRQTVVKWMREDPEPHIQALASQFEK
jgi:hypothetical protein